MKGGGAAEGGEQRGGCVSLQTHVNQFVLIQTIQPAAQHIH